MTPRFCFVSAFSFSFYLLLVAGCGGSTPSSVSTPPALSMEEQQNAINYEVYQVLRLVEQGKTTPEDATESLSEKGLKDIRYIEGLIREFDYYIPITKENQALTKVLIESIVKIGESRHNETVREIYNQIFQTKIERVNSRWLHGGSLVLQRLRAELSKEEYDQLAKAAYSRASQVDGEMHGSALEVIRYLIKSGDAGQEAASNLMQSKLQYNIQSFVLEIAQSEPIDNPTLLGGIVDYVSHHFYSARAKNAIAFQGLKMLDPIYARLEKAKIPERFSRTDWSGGEPVVFSTLDLAEALVRIQSPVLPILRRAATFSEDAGQAVFMQAIMVDEHKNESLILGIKDKDPRVASYSIRVLRSELANRRLAPNMDLLEAVKEYFQTTKNREVRKTIELHDFWGPDARFLTSTSTASTFDLPQVAQELAKEYWEVDLEVAPTSQPGN